MPPPISSVSALSSRLSITSIFPEIFDPPMMATKGRSGWVSTLPMKFSSFSISRPAADCATKWVMPSVEAWARCALPKASLT